MAERFGDAAVRLCSAASQLLGWRPDEFWSATPAELALAINLGAPASQGPDSETIEALRHRFPDDEPSLEQRSAGFFNL